jgi:hypothetical protein
MIVSAETAPPVETGGDLVDTDRPDSAPSERTPSSAPVERATDDEQTEKSVAEAAREEAVALIERSGGLPPALRERLKAAVANQPQVSLAEMIAAVEETLPDYLRAGGATTQPVHPLGEAFFSGAAGELSDSEAEQLAQQQLARAGLLRGQKVRVAD